MHNEQHFHTSTCVLLDTNWGPGGCQQCTPTLRLVKEAKGELNLIIQRLVLFARRALYVLPCHIRSSCVHTHKGSSLIFLAVGVGVCVGPTVNRPRERRLSDALSILLAFGGESTTDTAFPPPPSFSSHSTTHLPPQLVSLFPFPLFSLLSPSCFSLSPLSLSLLSLSPPLAPLFSPPLHPLPFQRWRRWEEQWKRWELTPKT